MPDAHNLFIEKFFLVNESLVSLIIFQHQIEFITFILRLFSLCLRARKCQMPRLRVKPEEVD